MDLRSHFDRMYGQKGRIYGRKSGGPAASGHEQPPFLAIYFLTALIFYELTVGRRRESTIARWFVVLIHTVYLLCFYTI